MGGTTAGPRARRARHEGGPDPLSALQRTRPRARRLLTRLARFTAALALSPAALAARSDVPHVVFVVGEGEYQSQATMPALAERLEESFGWRTTMLLDEELHAGEDNHVEGLDALEEADLLVLYLRFRQWPEEDLEALQAYVDRGGAIAAFRTSTHAFAYDRDDERAGYNRFGADVLGAPWIFHYGHDSATAVSTPEGALGSKLLRGVDEAFSVRSWTYHVRPEHPPADAEVLLLGTPVVPESRQRQPGPEAVNPVAWTRIHPGGGRVFMTTMGHPEDFRVESFRTLLGNGMHWALGLEPTGAAVADFPEVIHPDDREERDDEAPWERMDYGPCMAISLSIGEDMPPVNKALVMPLRTREGEETDLWAAFDTDLLSLRCVWRGELGLRGIVYDGPHGTFPEIDGEVLLRTAAVPGWVSQGSESPDPREEPFGPVPDAFGRWLGHHLDGDDVVLRYRAGDREFLQRLWVEGEDDEAAVVAEFTTTSGDDGLRVFDPSLSDRSIRATASGASAAIEEGVLTVPAGGTVRVAMAAGETPPPSPARDLGARAAATRGRGRWGAPLVTEGVIDLGREDGDGVRRSTLERGDSMRVARATGRRTRLELVGDGRADRSVIIEGAAPVAPGDLTDLAAADALLGLWPVGLEATRAERNALTGVEDLRLDGVTWRRGVEGRALDFDGTAAAWPEDLELDLEDDDATIAAWIQTTSDGTVFADARPDGEWVPDGVTLFLRGGQLTFDVGWVGALDGGPRIDDGAWHHVAATWRSEDGEVRLFVDGVRVARGELPLEGRSRRRFRPRFGWTNEDFPETPRFSGYMDGLALIAEAVDDDRVADLAAAGAEPIVLGTVVSGAEGAVLRLEDEGRSCTLHAAGEGGGFEVRRRRGHRSAVIAWAETARGGRAAARPFRIDRITWPEDNPHDSWMRFGAFDLVPSQTEEGPTSAVIATWSGDAWRVDGLDEDLDELTWQRIATGLNQPFGVLCEEGSTLVLGRDQITELVDSTGDGEADLHACVSNAPRNSEHFHEPASGLLRGPDGRLHWIKAARHAKRALHDQHGAIVRLRPDGGSTEVVARGFRAPIGLTMLPEGALLCSDQEGHWTPANRINLVRPDAAAPPFHGNGWSAQSAPVARRRDGEEAVQVPWPADTEMVPPLCWIHPSVDRSPSSQLLADHPAWGPLEGRILGLSYGTGEVYLVLREDVPAPDGAVITQGGVVKLGIQLPTGLLQGRIHPVTGDLYVCGLFGWSSDRTEPGGFHRIRPDAEAFAETLNVPTAMRAEEGALVLSFLAPLGADAAKDADRWGLTAWNYRRSSDYGSPTFDLEGRRDARSSLAVERVELSEDGRTVRLVVPDLEPCMQLHVEWDVEDAAGRELRHAAHLTINALRPSR